MTVFSHLEIKKKIKTKGILGFKIDIQNTLFVGHPVRLEFWPI